MTHVCVCVCVWGGGGWGAKAPPCNPDFVFKNKNVIKQRDEEDPSCKGLE